MKIMSAREAADKWGISQRRVAVLCSENRIANAEMIGNMWVMPSNAKKPIDARSTRYASIDSNIVKPFLKWAGGKGQLLKEIEKYYPFDDGKITKYAEPFVGGGAVLFDILNKYELKEIYISDIIRRNRLKNRGELEALLNILSSAIGSLTNPEKLKNTFRSAGNSRITTATINKYLKCLEDAFLIESAHRYDIKGRAYIETPKKYYFSDLGLRNARINFRQFEQTHAMENAIYNELKLRGFSVDVGVVPMTERDESGKTKRKQLEVDFVCNLGSKRYYIQSAYSIPDAEKMAQETRPFARIGDSFKKLIVTKDIVPAAYDENGVLTLNIYDFLLNPDSLDI